MINNKSHAARLQWVDMGKGIAMILVILYHCENSLRGEYVVEHYSVCYHSFFLPLFFFLSGYLFTSDCQKFLLGKKNRTDHPGYCDSLFYIHNIDFIAKIVFPQYSCIPRDKGDIFRAG